MNFTPTPEQEAILTEARDTRDNLLISALAGAAKTSTLVLVARELTKMPILSLAFNVRIKKEMESRLPSNCTSLTLNGLGHRAWNIYTQRRNSVDDKKTYRILSAIIEDLGPEDKKHAYENFADLKRNIEHGKACGWIPDGHYPAASRLMDNGEFFASLEFEPTDLEREIILSATLTSLNEAQAGVIDYADQLLLPTVFPARFEFYPLVLVDEAQDLSALNHVMLQKVARKRLIAVGDECQSIYGFRGAHANSMRLLKETFEMKELGLSISFRCPQNVVAEARWRAPHMKYPEWAKPGSVENPPLWAVEDIPVLQDGEVAIICRNNAPLFKMAIRLLRDGRYPELVGNDIGRAVIKQLKKLGEPSMPKKEVLAAIDQWVRSRFEKARDKDKLYDQADCLRVFAEQGSTLEEAIAYAERILAVGGPVKLMTGHKAKGLEFDTVFFLDQSLINMDRQQDRNLRYVIQTRSKNRLIYVRSDNYSTPHEE